MDFRRIQHFIHIAELGSLSAAAKRLNIVQPALSQSIKRLEDELGVTLFNRSVRGMELTEAGRDFTEFAYGILNQFNRAKESLSAPKDNPGGLVSVAMTESTLQVLTCPLCEEVSSRYPNIVLNMEAGLAGNIKQGFEAGQYDIVLSYLVEPDSTIHVEDLIKEDMYLASAYNPNNKRSDIRFKEMDSLPLILPRSVHGVGALMLKHARAEGVSIARSQIRAALNPTIQLVETGFGYSIFPWSAICNHVNQNRITARKIVEPGLSQTVRMIYPTHRPLTQATIAIMEIIRNIIEKSYADGQWKGELLLNRQLPGNQPKIIKMSDL